MRDMDELALSGTEIAIIGMAGRFPQAANIAEFWENIKAGKECITVFAEQELKEAGLDERLLKDPDYVKAYGWLEGAEEFDNAFFNYSERDASLMDPQMRLMHEAVWETLEDAGYDPETYAKRIGLYVGASDNLYWQVLSTLRSDAAISDQFETFQLNNKDFLATQIAYKLNLKGPAMLVSSACSTSLAAVHMACQAILGGECEMALAGGVTVSLPAKKGYSYQEGMILSPDGHCRAFAEDANGIVGANGVGVVALKLLEDALRDGDTIYALIRGAAMNNDGRRKVGYSAPSIEGQAEVIRMAHKMAETPAETISYVEAHGTGTSLGDLVEIEALKQAFHTAKRNYCAIGSVKSNVGHLDSAAGIAGLIKAVCILQHKLFPPAINIAKPNPRIDFANSPFYLNSALEAWTKEDIPLRVGVSSFGIGGTNVHVVLEETPRQVQALHKTNSQNAYELVPLSAESAEQLQQVADRIKVHTNGHQGIDLQDLAYTLQVGRKSFSFREAFVCRTIPELSALLDATYFSSRGPEEYAVKLKNPTVFFLFTGQGSHYLHMGAGLRKRDAVFDLELNRCLEILKRYTDIDFHAAFYSASGNSSLTDTSVVQPFLFAFEYALARTLLSLGIVPQALLGHSLGEYVAACISGVFSLEDALYAVVQRGKLMQRTHPGAMLSISAPETVVKDLIDSRYALAAVNSPRNTVVSGRPEGIEELISDLEQKGYLCRKIRTSHAFHSPMMEPILQEFHTTLQQIALNKPSLPFISNLTGTWITDEQATSAEYWCMQLRHTVRFEDGLTTLFLQNKEALFLEVGPGNTLCSFFRDHKDKGEQHYAVNTIRQSRDELPDDAFFLKKVAQMWKIGLKIRWQRFSTTERKRIPLPTYPFRHKNFLVKENPLNLLYAGMHRTGALLQKKEDVKNWLYLPVWKNSNISSWEDEPMPQGTTYLLFSTRTGFGSEFQRYLQERNVDVVVVMPGEHFQKLDEKTYIIDPADYNQYQSLCEGLEKNPISNIIHTWSIAGQVQSFADAQKNGFYSVLYLVKALGSGKKLWQTSLHVIGTGFYDIYDDDKIIPEKATLAGLLLVAQQENSLLRCKSIDIEEPGEEEKTKLFARIAQEIRIPTRDRIIAYRGTRRWVQTYERAPISVHPSRLVILQNGTYLITGGLGQLGLIFAEHLALEYKGKVALLTRSNFPQKQEWSTWLREHDSTDRISSIIEKLEAIVARGGEIEVFQADITDAQLLDDVLTRIEDQWGSINGVIHAAAETRTASMNIPLHEVSIADCNEQFEPKVLGTLALDKALCGRVDFCILFSSLSSILGGLGFVAYASANSFLDAFVQHKRKEAHTRWMSINWDSWNVGEENAGARNNARGFSIEQREGKEIFDLLVQATESQVIVSTRDLQQRLDEWVSLERIKTQPDKAQAVQPGEEQAQTVEDTEAVLQAIWKEHLGESNIGSNDNFFDLGGDSLKALSIIAKIQKHLHKKIDVSTFFKNPTIANLLYLLSDEVETMEIQRAVEKAYYPLGSSQERLWLIHQLHKDTTHYNLPQVLTIRGKLDAERIKHCFQELLQRHEALRTSFHFVKGTVLQTIHASVELDFTFIEAEATQAQELIYRFIRPFELDKPPLWRNLLIKTAPDMFLLLMDFHHIIVDGGSFKIFFEELSALYNGQQLTEPELRYRDCCEWENSQAYQALLAKQKAFWLAQFAQEPPILDLPVDFARKDHMNYEGSSLEFAFDADLSQRITHLVTNWNTTKFIFFLTVMNILLGKLSGKRDIVIGTPIAGRNHHALQNVFGHFLNVLPLRNQLEDNASFKQGLKNIESNTLEAFDNQHFSYKDIVEYLGIRWKANRNPLFDVMLVMQNIESQVMDIPGLVISPYQHRSKSSKFDLTLEVFENASGFLFLLEYCTELFSEQTVKQFSAYFRKIIEYVLDNQDCSLADIRLSARKDLLEPIQNDFEFD